MGFDKSAVQSIHGPGCERCRRRKEGNASKSTSPPLSAAAPWKSSQHGATSKSHFYWVPQSAVIGRIPLGIPLGPEQATRAESLNPPGPPTHFALAILFPKTPLRSPLSSFPFSLDSVAGGLHISLNLLQQRALSLFTAFAPPSTRFFPFRSEPQRQSSRQDLRHPDRPQCSPRQASDISRRSLRPIAATTLSSSSSCLFDRHRYLGIL